MPRRTQEATNSMSDTDDEEHEAAREDEQDARTTSVTADGQRLRPHEDAAPTTGAMLKLVTHKNAFTLLSGIARVVSAGGKKARKKTPRKPIFSAKVSQNNRVFSKPVNNVESALNG